jgi:hypothetical protein
MPGHWYPSKTCTQNGKPAARHKWAWDACNGLKKLQKQPPRLETRNSKSSTKPWNLNRQAPPKVLTCWKAPFCAWILQGHQTEDQGQQQLTTAYRNGSQVHSFMTHWSSTAPANAWWGRACTPSNKCGQRVRRSCHTWCTGHYYYHACWIQLGFKPGEEIWEGIWERGRERWHDMWNSWCTV